MFALNAIPQTATFLFAKSPPASSVIAFTDRAIAALLDAIAVSTSGNCDPNSLAITTRALVSFGKQDPPQPGPGLRNAVPMRLSNPIPSRTWSTFAFDFSDSAAMSFVKDKRIAR